MDAKYIKGMLNHPTLHPNDAINQWIAAILLFDFELVHIPAEKHTGADGLSHCPCAGEDPLLDDSDEIEDWIDSNAGFFIEVYSSPSPYDSTPPLSMLLDTVGVLSVSSMTPSITPTPQVEIPCTPMAQCREANTRGRGGLTQGVN